MIGLPCGEEIMTICLAVFIEYRNVTDRQTDGQTDRFNISISRVTVQTRDNTSSSAVTERPRDALCLSVANFNNTKRPAQSFIVSYITACHV